VAKKMGGKERAQMRSAEQEFEKLLKEFANIQFSEVKCYHAFMI
jgi:hypothetical protein